MNEKEIAACRDKIIHGTNKSEIYTERIEQSGSETWQELYFGEELAKAETTCKPSE